MRIAHAILAKWKISDRADKSECKSANSWKSSITTKYCKFNCSTWRGISEIRTTRSWLDSRTRKRRSMTKMLSRKVRGRLSRTRIRIGNNRLKSEAKSPNRKTQSERKESLAKFRKKRQYWMMISHWRMTSIWWHLPRSPPALNHHLTSASFERESRDKTSR